MNQTLPFAAKAHPLAGATLRPLKADEAGQFGEQLAALDPWLTLKSSATGLSLYLDHRDPALKRFTLVAGKRPAGLLTLRWPWLRGPFIEMLAILPEAQGKGLGRLAVEWAAAEAARVGPNLWASVSSFNEPARAFWAKTGFEEVAPLPDLVVPGFTDLLLRRRIH